MERLTIELIIVAVVILAQGAAVWGSVRGLGARVGALEQVVVKLDERVEAVRKELKDDIGKLGERVEAVRTELKNDIGKLSERVEAVRAELKNDVGKLSERLDAVQGQVVETRVAMTERVAWLEGQAGGGARGAAGGDRPAGEAERNHRGPNADGSGHRPRSA